MVRVPHRSSRFEPTQSEIAHFQLHPFPDEEVRRLEIAVDDGWGAVVKEAESLADCKMTVFQQNKSAMSELSCSVKSGRTRTHALALSTASLKRTPKN